MADSPESEQPADPTPVADEPADGAATADELKDRFRAALDRKRGAAQARSVPGHAGAGGKVHERNRRAGGKRTFRRKSG